jgi:uncharacterized protein
MSASRTADSTPWGLWATTGIALGIGAAFVLVQVLVTIAYVALARAQGMELRLSELESDGLLLALSVLTTAPVCIGLLAWAVRTRAAGVGEALGWRPVPWPVLGRWSAMAVLLMLAADVAMTMAGRNPVPDFMLEAYQTAVIAPLFWVAIVIAGPLFEELFFRGFLFGGIRASRLGASGAVVLTALAWAMVHRQYDLFEMTIVFIGGLLLGLARQRTGSTRVTFALHALWNFVATVEVVLVLRGT